MKFQSIVTLFLATASVQAGSQPDSLCRPLRAFVAAVGPDQSHDLAFHTIWGSNFRNSSDKATFAKHCEHKSYGPAEAVCKAFMEHGAVEFSNTNAERALVCLASGTRFGKHVHFEGGSFSLRYGSETRGSLVTLEYGKDPELGGMVLRVAARGY